MRLKRITSHQLDRVVRFVLVLHQPIRNVYHTNDLEFLWLDLQRYCVEDGEH